jgi:hypothetical protein
VRADCGGGGGHGLVINSEGHGQGIGIGKQESFVASAEHNF